MSNLKIHQGDKEVIDFTLYSTTTGAAITTDDVTAAEFVLVFGAVEITLTYGAGISSAVTGGVLTVTVTIPTASTDLIVTTAGSYQCRVTRGAIGPETVAEGTALGILKIES